MIQLDCWKCRGIQRAYCFDVEVMRSSAPSKSVLEKIPENVGNSGRALFVEAWLSSVVSSLCIDRLENICESIMLMFESVSGS